MAAQPSTEDSFTFVGGLNSEGGFFITPKNTWKDGDNIIPNTDGSIQRRKAIDYEDNYTLYDPDSNGGAVGGGGATGVGPGGIGGDGHIGYTSGEGFSLTMPANILAGDTLMAIVYTVNSATPSFPSWPSASPYIIQESSNGTRLYVYFRTATGTAADDTATFTVAGSTSCIWHVLAIRGVTDVDYPSSFMSGNQDYETGIGAGSFNSGLTTKPAGNHFVVSVGFGISPHPGGATPTSAPAGMTLSAITLGTPFSYVGNYRLVMGVAYTVFNGTTYDPAGWGDNGAGFGSGGQGALTFTITYDPLIS